MSELPENLDERIMNLLMNCRDEIAAAELLKRYNAYADQQAEIERLRVQLAGCGVAAWSASYDDVCKAVDREMTQRKRIAEQQAVIEHLVEACKNSKAALEKAQGEWLGVAAPYSPEWASDMAQNVDELDVALAAAEKLKNPEKKE